MVAALQFRGQLTFLSIYSIKKIPLNWTYSGDTENKPRYCLVILQYTNAEAEVCLLWWGMWKVSRRNRGGGVQWGCDIFVYFELSHLAGGVCVCLNSGAATPTWCFVVSLANEIVWSGLWGNVWDLGISLLRKWGVVTVTVTGAHK